MKIFSLEINAYKYEEFLQEISQHIQGGAWYKAIFTPNPEICLKTLTDTEFLEILEQADYLTSDGIGLYLGYQIQDFRSKFKENSFLWRILSLALIEVFLFNVLCRKKYLYKKYWDRICWSDLTRSLVTFAQENDIKIAILDPYFRNDLAKCESQKTFEMKLKEVFPKLNFDYYIYDSSKADEIWTELASSQAQIFFSTLGMKRQEISVLKAKETCPNLKLGLWVGSSFDYFIWFQKRAPKIWRSLGFEWLYRIFTSPGKLKRMGRIFSALVVFPIKIIFYKNK